jgi:hypothetical protein
LAGASPGDLGATGEPAHNRKVRILLILLVAASCATTSQPHHSARTTTGGIAGLTRDHDSGDPVAKAEIRVRAVDGRSLTTTSRDDGLYDIEALAPGTYVLVAMFAGQPVEVTNIEVRAGKITMVDIVFTLGRPEPIKIDFGNSKANKIDRYRPKKASPLVGIIEGTVNDATTKQRVVGAVVTAATGDVSKTQQTVSDDAGRFRFETEPGVYVVSAYYSVGGRGQIEVRRSDIAVAGAELVHVPLWIEMDR